MKWFKLDCDFRNDPKILCLTQQFGGKDACSFWILLLSYVGANGMPDCEIKVSPLGPHSPQLLASFLHTKPKVVLTMLEACANLRLIQPERWRNDNVISIPNMLKRVDDYSRKVRTKSEVSPAKSGVEQIEKKNRIEEDPPIPPKPAKPKQSATAVATGPEYTPDFEAFWASSTQRGSKLKAAQLWEKCAKAGLAEPIAVGMRSWKSSEQWQDETKQPHITTWLNRRGWEEIVPNGNGHHPKHVHGPQCRDYGFCPEAPP